MCGVMIAHPHPPNPHLVCVCLPMLFCLMSSTKKMQDAWLCEQPSIKLPALEGGNGSNTLPMIHVTDLCSVSDAAL